MFPKQFFTLSLALGCAASLAMPAAATEIESGSTYCFSPSDFSQEEITGICITDLPEEAGSWLLGSRVLRAGDILTAQQVSQMTFSPVSAQEDREAQLSYMPIYPDRVEDEVVMTFGIRGKENLAPVAEDQAAETYKNLPITQTLKAKDPEGEELVYTLVRSPKRGEVTIAQDGSFTYTPKKNKVGVDSFTYTAADPAGNVSREATVTLTLLKPTDAPQYRDTVGKDYRFAAEWMKNTGIFVGETLADNPCFQGDLPVSRGQFLTMLVKTLDLETEAEASYTGYADEIPQWLQPYLAAAIRSGLTAGLPDQQTFGAEVSVTAGEAAIMIQNALDMSVPTAAEEGGEGTAAALEVLGFQLSQEEVLTRSTAAQLLYQVSKYQA